MNTQWTEEVLSNEVTYANKPTHEMHEYNLMEQVIEKNNLNKAYKRVKQNKGAPGVDGMTIKQLLPYLKQHGERIRQELLKGTYRPKPVRRIEIPKPDGGIRELGVPTVLDRFIQQAILQILTPLFEPTFSDYSYGFRPGRGARQAVKQAQIYQRQGKRVVVDMDIEKFFDRVNHDMLMSKIAQHIKDKRIMQIIRRYLQSGVMINGCCVATEEGTPQGGPLSPLLSNVMLNDLDRELEKRGHGFARYADDCNIYIASRRAGERVLKSIQNFLWKKLRLKINETKSAVDRPWRRKFLGFSFKSTKDCDLRLAHKTVQKFENKIRELTSRSSGISMKQRIEKLNTYIMGWSGYFGIAEVKSIFEDLDKWIRRRLRACLLKQWKRCKTKWRNLVKLGITELWAVNIAMSRKKYWRLAKTPQINKALGLTYWQAQGLKSLVDRYHDLRMIT